MSHSSSLPPDSHDAQNGAQMVQNLPLIPEENEGFATSMGPQEAFTGAKPELLDAPDDRRQRLTTMLARLSSHGIQEILAVAVTDDRIVVVNRGGRPTALDNAARQKVCLLLKLGYTRSLAAAELGVARSTITRTMQRDPDFREQVLQAEELFERTPLLTILEAAQHNWRAAAWLMKNYQPHTSVSRRKRMQRQRESSREDKEWFRLASDAMSTPAESGSAPQETSMQQGKKIIKKTVSK